MQDEFIRSLARKAPAVLRWAGSIARELRKHNVAIEGKSSGSVQTDALTLADLTVQDLVINALRDLDPLFLECRVEAEETTGDLDRFATSSEWVLSLDPIDGTRAFRDKTNNGYAVMLHLRNRETVVYSLIYLPEEGREGTWVEVRDGHVRCGADHWGMSATEAIKEITPVDPTMRPDSPNIYLIGFQKRDVQRAEEVTGLGLKGFAPDEMPGSIYPLLSTGEFGGSLIHSPNVYDYPVSLHIVRALGGESIWVHNQQPVNFSETWMDDRADMLRLPGIIATSTNRETLHRLAELAKDWNPNRYDGD